MRLRHLLYGLAALVLIAVVVTLPQTHIPLLPDSTCTKCHGPGILRPEVMEISADGYTGPDACEPCHSEIYHIWTRSDHCRAMMNPGRTTVFSAFSPDTIAYGFQGFTTGMVSGANGYEMIVPNDDGVPQSYRIDLVLGIRDHQVFLTRFPDGRYQILPSTYDMARQSWFDATEGLIRSEHAFRPGDEYYWTNRTRAWNRACYDCHLSGMKKNYDPVTNTYNTQWRDLGIDCEACHGRGQEHARLRTINYAGGPMAEDTSLVHWQDLTPTQQVEACGQCHAKKLVMREGYQPGDDFHEYYYMSVMDADLVMPDGRYWGMMYNVLSMMSSPCYERGQITCTHCHSGHGTPRRCDLYEYENDDMMCTPCHNDIVMNPAAHSFHAADSEGSRCQSCHMQGLAGTHMTLVDHTFAIPVPENTIEFNSPNSCNECHSDQTPQWAIRWLDQWYGPDRLDRHSRARTFFLGKTRDTSAVRPLMVMLDDDSTNLIWRSTAALLLGDLRDRRALPVLVNNVRAEHPLLRRNVLEAVAKIPDPAVGQVLYEAVHRETNSQIRMFLAGKLGFWWRPDLLPEDRAIADSTWAQYKHNVNTLFGDWAESRRELAKVYLQRGEVTDAQREFGYALQLDSTDAPSWDGMSNVFMRLNLPDSAVVYSAHAVAQDPENADYRVNYARDLAATGQAQAAQNQLQRATELDPRNVPSRMNLALMLAEAGNHVQAARLLGEALAVNSMNSKAQYFYGRACMELGRRTEAAQAFVNVMALNPPMSVTNEMRQILPRLVPTPSDLPQPNVRPPDPSEIPIVENLNLVPTEEWPMREWPDYTPRITTADVEALGAPTTLAAAVDSARQWSSRGDWKFLPRATRLAYATRALAALDRYSQTDIADEALGFQFRIYYALSAAVKADLVSETEDDSLLALSMRVLSSIDTTGLDGNGRGKSQLGSAFYRLARSYDHARDFQNAIPAFQRAADLLPGSFAQAISYFFIGTCWDRIGNREEALRAHAVSAAHPQNSVRGVRCSVHAERYPFHFIPPFKGF